MKTRLRFSVLSSFCFLSLWLSLAPARAQLLLSTSICSGTSFDLNTLITSPAGSTVSWSRKLPATAIAAGSHFGLAVLANGSVVGWGRNGDYQLNVPPSATPAIAVAAGGTHSLALKANGQVVGWGSNDENQTSVPTSATSVTAIAAGSNHSLALKANGQVVVWGWNHWGQLNTPASATPAVAITAGREFNLALKSDGSIIGWGRGDNGQTNVPPSAIPATAVAGGSSHGLALKANGAIVGWGSNLEGQLSIPASATPAIAIAAGDYHSLAIKADGSVVGWGWGSASPASVPTSVTRATAVAAGLFHSLALLGNGSVVGWGANSSDQANGYDAQPVSATVSPTATQIYYYLIRNSSGSITGTGSITVVVRPLAALTAQPASQSAICVGGLVSVPVSVSGTGLGGTPSFSYQWYRNGAILTGNTSATTATLYIPSATTADAGSYSVVVTGACNSVTSTAFALSVQVPSATLTAGSVGLCAGGSVLLTGSGAGAGGNYAFSGPGGLNQSGFSPTVSVTQTGSYALTLTTGIGCTATTSLMLNVALTPTVFITLPNGSTVSVSGNLPTLTLPPNGPLVLQASGGTAYERVVILDRTNSYEIRQVDRNTTGIFPITRPGLFTLTVTGANGCSRTVHGVAQGQ